MLGGSVRYIFGVLTRGLRTNTKSNSAEYSMFGRLPAYGLYCRHVKGFKLLNVQLQLEKPDRRHAVVFEYVEDSLIECLDAPLSPDTGEMIHLTDVKKVFIRDKQNKMFEH